MIGDKLVVWYKNRMDNLVFTEKEVVDPASGSLAARYIVSSDGFTVRDESGEHFIPTHRIVEIEIKQP